MSSVEEIEVRRAARKEELEKQRLAQLAIDLAALDELEIEHGDSNVARLDVPYTPGLPTMVLVTTPSEAHIKRYREDLKPKKGKEPDPIAAAQLLGLVSRAYPKRKDEEGDALFAKMLAARPGIDVQMGLLASNLAAGRAAEEGKG